MVSLSLCVREFFFNVCVIHMDWHLSPYCWHAFSMSRGEWTGLPLENDKLVAKDRSIYSLKPELYLLKKKIQLNSARTWQSRIWCASSQMLLTGHHLGVQLKKERSLKVPYYTCLQIFIFYPGHRWSSLA